MNKRVLFSALILAVVCFVFSSNKDSAMLIIRFLLESGYLMLSCITFVVVSIVCHAIYVSDSALDVPMFKSNQLWILEILVVLLTL